LIAQLWFAPPIDVDLDFYAKDHHDQQQEKQIGKHAALLLIAGEDYPRRLFFFGRKLLITC
jgi:hypothetical protein